MAKNALSWGRRGTAAAAIAARLSFENIERHFDGKPALRGVSFDIEPAEILCLLGPSGCGKTTLLRIAAGIERPSFGRVLFNHQEVVGPTLFVPPEARHVGLMFQDFALFPHLSIIANVMFGLKGVTKDVARHVAESSLERVGLKHYAEDYPHILSGGEQQRVALARAIAPRPSILLMDEPFSGLDQRLRHQMREETLTILRETRTTSLIVTHQAEEAMRLGDRLAVMRSGRIEQIGTSEDIFNKPASLFVAQLFSEMNEIPCEIKNKTAITPFGNISAEDMNDGKAILCVRFRTLDIVAPGEGVIGRVIDRKFLGDAALLEMAVDGLENTLHARKREDFAPQIGEEVGVLLQMDKALIFKQ